MFYLSGAHREWIAFLMRLITLIIASEMLRDLAVSSNMLVAPSSLLTKVTEGIETVAEREAMGL